MQKDRQNTEYTEVYYTILSSFFMYMKFSLINGFVNVRISNQNSEFGIKGLST